MAAAFASGGEDLYFYDHGGRKAITYGSLGFADQFDSLKWGPKSIMADREYREYRALELKSSPLSKLLSDPHTGNNPGLPENLKFE